MGDAMTASGGASDCFVEGFDRRCRTLRVVPDSRDDGQKIGPGTATICWTGTDGNWGKENFHIDRPHVPTVTAKWLVERKLTLFCTDLIGMDDPTKWWWPIHNT